MPTGEDFSVPSDRHSISWHDTHGGSNKQLALKQNPAEQTLHSVLSLRSKVIALAASLSLHSPCSVYVMPSTSTQCSAMCLLLKQENVAKNNM